MNFTGGDDEDYCYGLQPRPVQIGGFTFLTGADDVAFPRFSWLRRLARRAFRRR